MFWYLHIETNDRAFILSWDTEKNPYQSFFHLLFLVFKCLCYCPEGAVSLS